jgi:hypothetical protein
VADRGLQCGIRAIMHVRPGELDVSKRWRAELVPFTGSPGSLLTPAVLRICGCKTGPHLGHPNAMKPLVGKVRPQVAGAAPGATEKQDGSPFLCFTQGRVVSAEVTVQRRVHGRKGLHFERRDGIGSVLKAEVVGGHSGIRCLKHRDIRRYGQQTTHESGPEGGRILIPKLPQLVGRPEAIHVAQPAAHLKPGYHRKHCLGRKRSRQTGR